MIVYTRKSRDLCVWVCAWDVFFGFVSCVFLLCVRFLFEAHIFTVLPHNTTAFVWVDSTFARLLCPLHIIAFPSNRAVNSVFVVLLFRGIEFGSRITLQ